MKHSEYLHHWILSLFLVALLLQGNQIAKILLIYHIGRVGAACVNSKKWCSSTTFSPPDLFRLYEGPIALEQRGYVRGVYTTDNSLHIPNHCTATNMVSLYS